MHRAPRFSILVLAGFFPLAAASRAGELPSRFTLGKYVPGDVWIYLHEASTPERAWIDEKWEGVFAALKASGIDRDITSFALSLIPGDEDRTAAGATIEKWTGLIKNIGWSQLCTKEFVYAQRIGRMPIGYEYFLLTRGDAESSKKNAEGLAKLLTEVAALSESMSLSQAEQHGAKVWSLAIAQAGLKVEVLHKGDIIALTVGPDTMSEVAALMAGKGTAPPIVKTERFATAIKRAESPEFMVSFMDIKVVLGNARGLMKRLSHAMAAARQAQAAAQPSTEAEAPREPEGVKVLSAVSKIFDRVDVVDYIIETRSMDGRRERRHTMTRIQEDKQKCALASCFLDRKPFQKFDQYIPAEATAFNLSTTIDVGGLYNMVLDIVKNDIADGPAYIARWEAILDSTGFDPQRDIFSWLSGEIISVEMPPAVVTPMGGADWVLMIRVKDSQIAKQKIDAAIDYISNFAQGQGQALMITPAEVNAEGFRQVTHPMFMMMMRPVIGVKDEWVMVGSSAAAVNKCLETAGGKSASIVANERFKTEGLAPKGAVLGASYKDTSKFGQELAQVAGAVGMGAGMAMSMIPPEPGAEKVKPIVQKAATIIMKLGPVLQKIDFFSSESSVTTYDGEGTVRGETVVMYKAPTGEEIKTAAVK